MDAARFDQFARRVAVGFSRREVLRAALFGGVALLGNTRRANAYTGLTGCRPAVQDFPNPRPPLKTPFRAVKPSDSPPTSPQCTLPTAKVGVTPVVTGGYGGGDTHTDGFYNEYFAVDFAPVGGGSFPVLAAADGILDRFDERGSTGEDAVTLWITHNAYWKTKYTHLSNCGVRGGLSNGQTASTPVKAGDQIGWAGMTGATAIHLHFELRGGDASNHTSYPSDPSGLYGNGDCCNSKKCNWSYPVPELGVPAPPSTQADTCPVSPASCFPPQRKIVPGGMWVAPKNGATISTSPLRLEARAYRTVKSDPAIAYVNFTAWWTGFGPKSGPWKVLCSPAAPDHDDVYVCDADVMSVPAGPLAISFDVYDTAGNRNLAPNGTRETVWEPESGCPNGQIKCDEECVDPKTSHDHCGRCDNECGIFGICCRGVCGCDNTTIIPFYCMGATVLCAPGE